MRPFKNKLPLSLEVLLATLVVGVPYTPRRLGLMFEGGAPAVLTLLERATAIGAVRCSGNVRGYTTRYWLSSTYTPGPHLTAVTAGRHAWRTTGIRPDGARAAVRRFSPSVA